MIHILSAALGKYRVKVLVYGLDVPTDNLGRWIISSLESNFLFEKVEKEKGMRSSDLSLIQFHLIIFCLLGQLFLAAPDPWKSFKGIGALFDR